MKQAETAPDNTSTLSVTSAENGKSAWAKETRVNRKRKRSSTTLQKNGPEEVYEVESIYDYAVNNGKVTSYKVKWKGWSEDHCTWEPLENLRGCLETVVEYFEKKIFCSGPVCYEYRIYKMKETLQQHTDAELQNLMRVHFTVDGHNIPPVDQEEIDYLVSTVSKLPPHAQDSKLINEIRLLYMRQKLIDLRNKQILLLKKFEDDINKMSTGPAVIKVVNTVDLDTPSPKFSFINHYISLDESVFIPDDPLVGCSCTTCNRGKCCNNLDAGGSAYSKGILKVNLGTPIYECNKKCLCGPDCENRVLQHGRKVPIAIFKTHNGCGWGVRALSNIKKGEFVTEYVGEIITTEEAERRGRRYDKEGSTYLSDLDFNEKDNFPYTVDAAFFGNESHFINHSCSPNLEVYAVWVNCLDPNIPLLGLYACKNIKKGEELTFDYLCQPLNSSVRNSENSSNKVQAMCKCGAQNCRKFLF